MIPVKKTHHVLAQGSGAMYSGVPAKVLVLLSTLGCALQDFWTGWFGSISKGIRYMNFK